MCIATVSDYLLRAARKSDEMLEPYEGKLSRTVLREEGGSNTTNLLDYELQKAFQYLMKEKTVIMIAHRLSSIKSVDEILVLSEGKIVERGNHNELMAKHRVYKQLVTNYENANDWRLDNEKFL